MTSKLKLSSKINRLAIVIFAMAGLLFLYAPSGYAYEVIPIRNLNFGRTVPFTTNIKLALDAKAGNTAACVAPTRCDNQGSYGGILHFEHFDNMGIRLGFPSSVELKAPNGQTAAWLRNMHMYSDTEPYFDSPYLKARIGGELNTSTQAYGKDLSGTINIEIIIY